MLGIVDFVDFFPPFSSSPSLPFSFDDNIPFFFLFFWGGGEGGRGDTASEKKKKKERRK